MDALGSDAEKGNEDLVDADGNPMKLKKKKTKICEHVQRKKVYKEDGVDMATQDKYYVDYKYVR